MIMSIIARRKVLASFDAANRGDVDSVLADWADDAVYDFPSDISVGGTITGKKAIAEWFRRWIEEYPKRKLVLKNVCLRHSCLPLPTNVMMIEWSCEETNKEGKEFKYDGVSVVQARNFKSIRVSEYISFAGLPEISTLLK